MKTETFKGSVDSAYGKPLPSTVTFTGSFEAFESYDEVKTANEILSNDEMLNVVNAKRKAAARAKATTAALDAAGIAKPDPNDPATIRENTIKLYQKMFPGLSEENARKMLEATEASAKALATA